MLWQRSAATTGSRVSTTSAERNSLDSCRTAYLKWDANEPTTETDHDFIQRLDEIPHRERHELRSVAVRTLLHLPRVADHGGFVTKEQIDADVDRFAEQLAADQGAVKNLISTREVEDLDDLEFKRLDADGPAEIFDHLHYLRRARAESDYYALVNPADGLPVSICSVSPLQWRRVGQQLTRQFGVPMGAVREVSRLFTCDVAPKNSVSRLLKMLRKALESESDAQLLSTVVDPNPGFTGASYRASNWQQWMTVRARPYLYYDKNYMSLREMRARFPAYRSIDELCDKETKAERSRVKLRDSLIFCYRIRAVTERVPVEEQHRLTR